MAKKEPKPTKSSTQVYAGRPMVSGAVGGIVGIYLSVPIAAALRVVYRNLASPKNVLSTPDAVNEHLRVTSSV